MPIIRDARIEVREIPLRHPFATSRDAAPRHATPLVRITLRTDEGILGTGECVPVPYVTGETHATVEATLNRAVPDVLGANCLRPQEVLRRAEVHFRRQPAALAGLEMAIYDAFCKECGVTLWELCGGAIEAVTTDVTLSIGADAPKHAAALAHEGFRIFKVKLGRGDLQADLRVLETVHEAVPNGVLRLDANQAYAADEALHLIDEVVSKGLPVELLEQPVDRSDLGALHRVAAASPIPIFADEAVLTPQDAMRLVEHTAVHGVNVKLMKSGLRGALAIAAVAKAADRKLMMGCMLETSRGIGTALALAAGTGLFDYFDLDAHLLTDAPPWQGMFESDGALLRINRR